MPSSDAHPATRLPVSGCLGQELGDSGWNGLLATHRGHAADEVLAIHEHTDAYLCLVLAGGYLQQAGSDIECVRGSVVAHPPGHVHANRFGEEPTRCINLHFGSGWADDPVIDGLLSDYTQLRLDPRDKALARLEREFVQRDAGSALAVASAALEIVGRLASIGRDAAPAWLRAVTEALASELAEPPTLASLAAIAGVHPAHLCRSFSKATGETIGTYSRRLRLEAADAMLAGSLPIADIALATGFYDQAHLARCFRRHFGLSPSARRAQSAS